MTPGRPTWLAVMVVAMAVAVAGCGTDSASKDDAKSRDEGDRAAEAEDISGLMLNGRVVGAERDHPAPSEEPARRKRVPGALKRLASVVDETDEWPALPLLGDGTIDAGTDPFLGRHVPALGIPIEDDPDATKAIDAVAMQLRRVDIDQWNAWMGAAGSPWAQAADPTADAMVKVTTERCGGARTVATGVVLDDDTVVTTVHAVENAAKRVRVSSAVGESIRIPAMVRYLDVDDDIAVLRVPGLGIEPMPWFVPVDMDPLFAYAYGVGSSGRAGNLRRVPVVTSMQEQSITVEQPDGFDQEISERPVQTAVGGFTTGFSGGVVAATNDTTLRTGWGFHAIVRARVPFRANTAGVLVPQRIVEDALDASDRLDEWYEHRPGGCPQWYR